MDRESLQQIATLLDEKLKPFETALKSIDTRLEQVAEKINLTYEHVGQITEEITEIRNSTDYIKHKITDHDEKLYLLNKKTL